MGTCERKEGHLRHERAFTLSSEEQINPNPPTGEMLRVIGLTYPDPVVAKHMAMEVWREQGRVLTYATAVELLYARLVKDTEREAKLLAMYAKKRGERK